MVQNTLSILRKKITVTSGSRLTDPPPQYLVESYLHRTMIFKDIARYYKY